MEPGTRHCQPFPLLLNIQIHILFRVEPALYDHVIHVLLCDRNRKQFPVRDEMCIRDRGIEFVSVVLTVVGLLVRTMILLPR